MDKKYQIFVSSTYEDLKGTRQKVMDTVLALHQIPAGMEMFPAGDDDQWTHIKSEIDKSDYYVLILGHRYGSIAPDGISWTEKEYDYARDIGIPVLAFIINRDTPVKVSDLDDSDAARKKLKKFGIKAKGSKLCKFWSNIDELATKVSTSLSHAFSTHPRVGWVRGDQAVTPQFTEELVILSKENRQLKAELDTLRKLSSKSPVIGVQLVQDDLFELTFISALDDDFSSLEIPKELSMENVPEHLKEFLTEEYLEKYNRSVVEDAEKARNYNSELKLHNFIEQMGFELDILINNIGDAKGNNIYVDIEFPEAVIVLEGSKEDHPVPKKPTLKTSPLKKAAILYSHKYEKNAGSTVAFVDNFISTMDSFNPILNSFDSTSSVYWPSSYSKEFNSRLSNNTVTIYCKELIQTREKRNNDLYTLIPIAPGEYEIKISVICEEYSEPDVFIVPLIIHEK